MAVVDGKLDPTLGLQRRLRRFGLFAYLCIILEAAIIAATVVVIWHLATQSMAAFNQLPTYQMNTLRIGYQAAVRDFDQASASLRRELNDDKPKVILEWAPQLSRTLLATEQEFQRTLDEYGLVMAQAAEQVGGALEWNQHFQTQLAELRERSLKRQAGMQAYIDVFPAFKEVELPATYPFKKRRR